MTQPVVLVLAGGAANRFWPLRDKQLVEFGSYSLLERHLRALASMGCGRFVVVVRPDMRDEAGALGERIAGADVRVAVQTDALGMGDAVLSAAHELERFGDSPIYVTQAHDVVEQRLHAAMLDSWASRADGVSGLIAASRVQSYFPGGYLKMEGERVTGVIEKPGAGHEPSDLVNLVAHVFSSWKTLASLIEEESRQAGDDVYERALSRLMQSAKVGAQVYDGRWQALKYPWHMLDVMDLLLDFWRRGLESPGPDYEQREDGVFVGRNVRIFHGGYIAGPALIGHDCIIGNNALVRGSLVSDRSVVGFGSEVARSYLGEHVELHHNYVGDSVMDRETSMGYGATTANYRLDSRTVPSMVGGQRVDSQRMKLGMILGANSRIGVNTSTMPGVKIGAGAIVGPMLKVVRDVPDGERVLDEEKYGRF